MSVHHHHHLIGQPVIAPTVPGPPPPPPCQGYASCQGGIGTAVQVHVGPGGLPYTGLDVVVFVLVAVVVLVAGVVLRWAVSRVV